MLKREQADVSFVNSIAQQALFVKAIVEATIKEVNRAGHLERKAEVVNRLLNGNWVRKGGGVTNGSGAVGGRSDGGNAGLLRKQSERKPSAAFESVLRNLFQVQETESVNNTQLAVVSVRKGSVYGQNARNRKSHVGSDGETGVSDQRDANRNGSAGLERNASENSNGNRTDSAGGRIPQTAGQKPSADCSDAVKKDLAALGVEKVKGTDGKSKGCGF